MQGRMGVGYAVNSAPRVPSQPTTGAQRGTWNHGLFVFIRGFTVFKAKY